MELVSIKTSEKIHFGYFRFRLQHFYVAVLKIPKFWEVAWMPTME